MSTEHLWAGDSVENQTHFRMRCAQRSSLENAVALFALISIEKRCTGLIEGGILHEFKWVSLPTMRGGFLESKQMLSSMGVPSHPLGM